jgi:hypothetical protein
MVALVVDVEENKADKGGRRATRQRRPEGERAPVYAARTLRVKKPLARRRASPLLSRCWLDHESFDQSTQLGRGGVACHDLVVTDARAS